VPADTLTKARVIGRHAGLLIIDGYYRHSIKKKDIVKVTRAKNKAYFVKFNKNYLKKVRRALS